MGWNYPRVLAHRGAGRLAPENTLAAMAAGLEYGYRAVEFDVMLSSDEVPVLMHDPQFGRTVAGSGAVAQTLAADLVTMDAGAWFDARYAGVRIPLYTDVLAFCQAHGIFMNVEIKPAPGFEERTGRVVAQVTRDFLEAAGAAAPRLLFSSFSSQALACAQEVAPGVARGALFDTIPEDWLARLRTLECVALHCNHRALDAALVTRIREDGFGVFCYTVNEVERARELLGWGIDAFCTDRIDEIGADFAAFA